MGLFYIFNIGDTKIKFSKFSLHTWYFLCGIIVFVMCVVSLFGMGKGVNRETGLVNREDLNIIEREGYYLFVYLFIYLFWLIVLP